LLVLVLPALLAAGAPVAAAPAAPALARTTTIRGTRTAYVDVRLPRAATVRTPFGPSPDIAVSGAGRFVGVALVGTEARTRQTTLFGGRLPDAAGTRFLLPIAPYPAVGGGSFEVFKTYGDTATLPAGKYRLYLLTDGRPVTVTLRLAGLAGTAALAPRRPAPYQLAFPAARPAGGNGLTTNVYSAGATFDPPSAALLFHALWVDTSAHVAGQYFLCHREGPGGIEPLDHGPGCPEAQQMDFTNDRTPTTEPDGKLHLHGYAPVPDVEHALGFWYATESVVTDVRYVALSLAL
jgi:hypothetical protein